MHTASNYVAFCMDSLRWDIFNEANAPNLKSFTDYKRAYSRAGCTVPSIFSTFMNIPWYEARKEKLIPWLKSWAWVPSDLSQMGYSTAFFTSNPMFKLYRPTFEKGFDDYKIFGSSYSAATMIQETIEFFEKDGPKFVFLLFMETHHPYVHHNEVQFGKRYPIKHQRDALETLDKEFSRLLHGIRGTDTEIIIFSDHGDLDMKREGDHGHGHGTFHRKLFEIPLGRGMI